MVVQWTRPGRSVPTTRAPQGAHLPKPLPAPPAPPLPESGEARRADGTFASSELAKAAGSRGGARKASGIALAKRLGLERLAEGSAFKPYQDAAATFRKAHVQELTSLAGGQVGPGPCSMVTSAALQLAASRYLFDQAAVDGDVAKMKQASALANDSRGNLLAAYELAVREGKLRATAVPKQVARTLAVALDVDGEGSE